MVLFAVAIVLVSFVGSRWVCVIVTGMAGFGVCTGSGIPSELESWRLLNWLLVGITVGFLVPGLVLCSVIPSIIFISRK